MKFLLQYNYNFRNPYIYKVSNSNNYLIRENKKKFILEEIIDEFELTKVKELSRMLNDTYYKIVENVAGKDIVEINNKKYVLLEVNEKINRVALENEIIYKKNNEILNFNVQYYQWYMLWCKKCDYIEYQYKQRKGKNLLVDESIDYFLGMAETAISYLKEIEKNNVISKYCISHKRIDEKNYYNPLNVVIDVKERDISEYVKYIFFYNKITNEKLQIIINKINYEGLSSEKIIARLLFPTYYFDALELSWERNDNKQIKIVLSKIEEYEKIIKKIYHKVNEHKSIKKIDWI